MNSLNRNTVVISDAHVSKPNENVDLFFDMLKVLEKTDYDIVFLGDLFDLWVGWSRYQKAFHWEFLEWCKREKKVRQVGMVEGNHEFYICRNFQDSFSWCAPVSARKGGIWFEHGDLINYHDRNYLNFRRLCKNPVTCQAFRFLPGGPRLVQRLKEKLRMTNLAYKAKLPEKEIMEFAGTFTGPNTMGKGRSGIERLVFGHFHSKRVWSLDTGLELISMPAWLNSGEVGLFEDGQPATFLHWKELHQ